MMKRITGLMVLLMLFVLLSLTGCTSTTTTAPLPTATPTPTVDPNALVIFQEGQKYGVQKGSDTIMDAVWDDIDIYQIGDEEYIKGRLGTSWEDYRDGLFKADGSVIFDVSDDSIYYDEADGHYITRGRQLIDTNTWEVVLDGIYLECVFDEYAIIEETYADLSAKKAKDYYNIYDIKAQKYLFKIDEEPAEGLTYHIPEYYEGKGFLVKVTRDSSDSWLTKDTVYVTLTGKVFDSANGAGGFSGLDIYPEENILVVGDNDGVYHDVFLLDSGEHCGFRLHICPVWKGGNMSQWGPVTCSGGERIIVGKQDKGGKDVFVIYNIDQNSITPIPDAVEVYSFEDDMAIVENSDGKYGYINASGTLIYPYQFMDVENFSDGKAQAVLDYKNVTLDKDGNIQQ